MNSTEIERMIHSIEENSSVAFLRKWIISEFSIAQRRKRLANSFRPASFHGTLIIESEISLACDARHRSNQSTARECFCLDVSLKESEAIPTLRQFNTLDSRKNQHCRQTMKENLIAFLPRNYRARIVVLAVNRRSNLRLQLRDEPPPKSPHERVRTQEVRKFYYRNL